VLIFEVELFKGTDNSCKQVTLLEIWTNRQKTI